MLLVVGGQSRNVGKTSLAAQIIARFRQYNWTAVKVTQHGHVDPGRPYALDEEFEPAAGDSGRYLRAGARRSFWLRTPPGRLADAVPALRDILAAGAYTLVESNSILEYFDPDLYIVVLDFACKDFKPSTLRFLDRADACVVIGRGGEIPPGPWEAKRRFLVRPPDYLTASLSEFLAGRFPALA